MTARKPVREGPGEPFSQFNFLVDLGDGREGGFQEMSALDQTVAAIDYRTSRSPGFSTLKMPGIAALARVTLKRGLIAGGGGFGDWHRAVLLGRIERRTIRIRQRDEQRRPLMTWILTGARPETIEGPATDTNAETVAVETLGLVCERIAAEG